MGQILTRLRLTCCATDATEKGCRKTFKILFTYTILFIIAIGVLFFFSHHYSYFSTTKGMILIILGFVLIGMSYIFLVYLVSATRNKIRRKYDIKTPLKCCEDLMCGIFCWWCTISQMARQTADYSTYKGWCCSRTGLHPKAAYV